MLAVVYQNNWVTPVLTLINKAEVSEVPYSNRSYITEKDKQQKWIMGTVGMAFLAAILSGIMTLILK